MGDLLDRIAFSRSETDPARLPDSEGEVAFVGRSNVGKSSLINAVARKDLAKVSSSPGRTRTINVFDAGGRWLVDLPGYGFAKGPAAERQAWAAMIEGYLTSRPALRAVVVLLDAKVGPTRLDQEMLDWLAHRGLPYAVVATKADQVGRDRAAARRREVAHAIGLQEGELAWVSAERGYGIKELRGRLCALLQP